MGVLSNIFDFEKFKLGNMWDKVKENPEQLLLGAGDPFSAKAWGGITGKDYEPLVDQWGGATPDDYSKAEAAGVNTRDGRGMHDLAKVIASAYAGKWANGLGGGGDSGTGGQGLPGQMPAMGGRNYQAPTPHARPVMQAPYNPYNDPAVQSTMAEQQRRAVADALLAQQTAAGYKPIGSL